MARRANFPPGDAREDWAILRALSAKLDVITAVSTISSTCARPCTRRHRILPRSTSVEPADAGALADAGSDQAAR